MKTEFLVTLYDHDGEHVCHEIMVYDDPKEIPDSEGVAEAALALMEGEQNDTSVGHRLTIVKLPPPCVTFDRDAIVTLREAI